MKLPVVFIFFVLFVPSTKASVISLTKAQEADLQREIKNSWGENPPDSTYVHKGDVVAWSDVKKINSDQELHAKVIGLHPRSCQKGLRKISRYEDYRQHMAFVKESTYSEQNQQVRFLLDHTLLPFPMILAFKLPRITGPGSYPFFFPNGIFANLRGEIKVTPVGNRCLYFLKADWRGPSTKLPDTLVGTFAQTLIRIGLEHLIRISKL